MLLSSSSARQLATARPSKIGIVVLSYECDLPPDRDVEYPLRE